MKWRLVGSIHGSLCVGRFIGELYKQRMLLESIMHECVVKLLRANDQDSLECLCRLLATIGKDIDNDEKKVCCLPTSTSKLYLVHNFLVDEHHCGQGYFGDLILSIVNDTQ